MYMNDYIKYQAAQERLTISMYCKK